MLHLHLEFLHIGNGISWLELFTYASTTCVLNSTSPISKNGVRTCRCHKGRSFCPWNFTRVIPLQLKNLHMIRVLGSRDTCLTAVMGILCTVCGGLVYLCNIDIETQYRVNLCFESRWWKFDKVKVRRFPVNSSTCIYICIYNVTQYNVHWYLP